jgi:uncharacterized protein (TIGR03435 family)
MTRTFVRLVIAFGMVMVAWAGSVAAQTMSLSADTAAKPQRFEVASIRLIPEGDLVPSSKSPFSPPGAGLFTMRQVTLAMAIAWAFHMDQNRISGGPAWLDRRHYEISAKPYGDVGLSYDQLRPLVQKLLQDRFHLTFHREAQNRKGYALVVAKDGPKLDTSKGASGQSYILQNGLRGNNVSIGTVASMLTLVVGSPVVDQTGLTGNYDIKLNYAPLEATDSSLPSIFTALDEQLGLKLVSRMVPVETLVIDHVDEVPTEN